MSLKGAQDLALGVAYKPNVDDTRGSASFKIIRLLQSCGAEVAYQDPFVLTVGQIRYYRELAGMQSIPW